VAVHWQQNGISAKRKAAAGAEESAEILWDGKLEARRGFPGSDGDIGGSLACAPGSGARQVQGKGGDFS
jgi:hypothetical protein